MHNGTHTRTLECGCIVTRLYGRGELIESFVEPCPAHEHLLDDCGY